MRCNDMCTTRVVKSVKENYRVHTIETDFAMGDALPGQFLMVWMPGLGEKPMSIGDCCPLTISVAEVGKVSEAIGKLKAGDMISFRGPFGKPFTLPKKDARNGGKILLVGGGYGVVPMLFLAKHAKERGLKPTAVIGARAAKDIVWEERLGGLCEKVLVTTDDGSKGKKGTVMIEVERMLAPENGKPAAVYACGPERMMKAVAELCDKRGVPCQVSLERYMKCGMGVCGSCAIDGKLCCTDGPVFDGVDALAFSEFGKPHRDASGKTPG